MTSAELEVKPVAADAPGLAELTPRKLTELGSFAAVTGKTWNHPVIAGGKLLVRNGEEMACFEVEK